MATLNMTFVRHGREYTVIKELKKMNQQWFMDVFKQDIGKGNVIFMLV